jgi:hypothetical protein
MSTFARNADGQEIQGELVIGAATAHRQVTASNGAEVDEGIRELLEALWCRGMVTEFSCQGEHGELAHICFARSADAHRFMESPGDFEITVGESRAWVDFPAHLIGALTRYWST